MVAYAANAEMSCFLALGWPFPCNVLDLYVETIAEHQRPRRSSGHRKDGPACYAALELHGLPAPPIDTKTDMRRLILEKNGNYTEDEWRAHRRL